MNGLRRGAARSASGGAVLLVAAMALYAGSASGYEGEGEADREASAPKMWEVLQQQQQQPIPQVIAAARYDTSKPLRSIKPVVPFVPAAEAPENPGRQVAPVQMPEHLDPFLQTNAPKAAMPPPNVTFEGVPAGVPDYYAPPDTNGDVGLTQYVQTVNVGFAVYSKAGTQLYPALPAKGAAINTLFAGFGGVCQSTNNGDPIVQYDQLANRWLISQFAWSNISDGPFSQCVAVSTSGDATGSYYRYEFEISPYCSPSCSLMNDYPKFGVWPDAYYASFNDFRAGAAFTGVTAVAFDRTRMLAGLSATAVKFVLGPQFYSLLPADLDGATLPPAGAPNAFVQMDDDAWGYPTDQLEVWKFHVDFATPANSTFTTDATPATASFSRLVSGIPQPSPGASLDTLGDRLMYRLAYRNFGDHEALIVNHSVSVSGRAGIRWYELRRTGGPWSIVQQGTYAPADGLHRWMGSVAMDKVGNMAGGWSVSNSSTNPSINYGGRLTGDPAGTLTMESRMTTGGGVQTAPNRWGDYSSISVDPTDDCTFWYTTEYYSSNGSYNWKTRIGSFTFPSCNGAPPPPPPPPPPTAVTFNATADARVVEASPSTNYGKSTTLKTVGGSDPDQQSYLRFSVSGLDSAVTKATLRLYASSSTVDGPSVYPTSGSWTETGITWSNRPGTTGPALSDTGAIPSSTWAQWDVTALVSGNGTYNLTLRSLSNDSVEFRSREASTLRPQLVVETGSVTPPPPPPPSPPSISSFSPTSGPVGTIVTVNGSNFTGATSVKFNGTSATFTVNSSSKITSTVPNGATTGTISVTTPAGTALSASSFTVTTVGPPSITSFSPTSGPPGTLVTINGTNFVSVSSVTLGFTKASFTVVSSTQIKASAPAKSPGNYLWRVTTPKGTATASGHFSVT